MKIRKRLLNLRFLAILLSIVLIGGSLKVYAALPSALPIIESNPHLTSEELKSALAPGSIFLASIPTRLSLLHDSELQLIEIQWEGQRVQPSIQNYDRSFIALFDFKKQSNGYLSYFARMKNRLAVYNGETLKDTEKNFRAGPGHLTDPHDFILLNESEALVMGIQPKRVDLSDIGGNPQAISLHMAIQKVERLESGKMEVKWSWSTKSLLEESTDITNYTTEDIQMAIQGETTLTGLPSKIVDYAHINSFAIDPKDGNLIVSIRHFDSILKLDSETGEVLWWLGGVGSQQNDFEWMNDSLQEQGYSTYENPEKVYGFSHQHKATPWRDEQNRLHLLLFDNGNLKSNRDCWDVDFDSCTFESRAVEYLIDEEKYTVEKIWDYKEGIMTTEMGSVQRLENNNVLIGWGGNHSRGKSLAVTEVQRDESLSTTTWLLHLYYPENVGSYRAYKYVVP